MTGVAVNSVVARLAADSDQYLNRLAEFRTEVADTHRALTAMILARAEAEGIAGSDVEGLVQGLVGDVIGLAVRDALATVGSRLPAAGAVGADGPSLAGGAGGSTD